MNRPLVWAAAAFCCGIFLAGTGYLPTAFTAIAWTLIAGCVLLVLPRPLYRDYLFVALPFLLAGALLYQLQHREPPGTDPLAQWSLAHPESVVLVEGHVREAPLLLRGAEYARILLHVDTIEHNDHRLPMGGGVRLRWYAPTRALLPGERIAVEGKLSPHLGFVNFGARGVEDYYRARGIHTSLNAHAGEVRVVGAPTRGVRYWAARLRMWEAGHLARVVPEDILPFILTVWLGEQSLITQQENQTLINAGTAHILAVSGMNVAIIFVSVSFLLKLLIHSRRTRAALIILAVLLYAVVAGARAPSMRAALMVCLYLAAELFDREPDVPTGLGLSALLLLLWDSGQLFDAGFLLSFGSVASILLYAVPLQEFMPRLPRIVRADISVAFGVHVLTFPLAMHLFHVFPLLGPFVNLLVVPALTIILWLTMLTIIIAPLVPPLARLLGHSLWPFVWIAENASLAVASLPVLRLSVASPTLLAVFLYLVAAALLAWALQKQQRKIYVGSTALFALAWLCWRPWFPQATVDFIDVGHGDSTFIRTPDRATFLVDGGDRGEFLDVGAAAVAPFLLGNGVKQLDFVVATHSDRDHMGGLFHIVERLGVGTVLLGPESHTPLERQFLAHCMAHNVPVRRLVAGETLRTRDATIEVLHPAADWRVGDSTNNASLVLRVRWPGMDLLLTGDIEREAEAALAQTDVAAAILKTPHHGSDTSSTAPFLDAVRPSVAIISTRQRGAREPTGVGVLERYTARGIQVWRTDMHGGLRLRVPREDVILESARAQRGWPAHQQPAS